MALVVRETTEEPFVPKPCAPAIAGARHTANIAAARHMERVFTENSPLRFCRYLSWPAGNWLRRRTATNLATCMFPRYHRAREMMRLAEMGMRVGNLLRSAWLGSRQGVAFDFGGGIGYIGVLLLQRASFLVRMPGENFHVSTTAIAGDCRTAECGQVHLV